MIKKFIYVIIGLAGLLMVCYLLQPIKKGKGLDTTLRYDLVKTWPDLPKDLDLGNPTGLGIDTNQNIVIFHRAERKWPMLGSMPESLIKSKTVLVIDKENGQLISSWGDNLFIMPHGLTVDHDNNIWVTDVGLHQVFKFSNDGKLLLQIGEPRVAGNDSLHFNKPTDIAVARDGSFYVSDGYGNSRVMKFSATGNYLRKWGTKGDKFAEFNIPHAISLDNQGNVYVADRENNRIQVFDSDGVIISEIKAPHFGAICSVLFDSTQSKIFAVDDFTFLKLKHRGSDVLIIDSTGNIPTIFGRSGNYTGKTSWYHDMTIDKEGNIYVGDILGNSIQKFRIVR